jgi:hypothetical protein
MNPRYGELPAPSGKGHQNGGTILYAGSVRRFVLVLTRTVAIYAFAAWAYVALVAVFLPHTLGYQLTHFSKQPHTDTFGEVSFVVSLVSYFVYRMLTEPQSPSG